MPYVNARDMLARARQGHYAVGQFNLNNLECIRTFMEAAEETHSPIILGVSGNIAKAMGGYKLIADVTRDFIDALNITVPVCLHADHGTFEQALSAAESGFTSVMYDGSHDGMAENIRRTRYLAELCHSCGLTLETEVGAVAGEEDGVSSRGECASPEDCRIMAELGVDLLAAGIGNVHGAYPSDWAGLDFALLREIRRVTGEVPLVLHGGSGISEGMIQQAITEGICKINVNTECREAFDGATCQFVQDGSAAADRNHTRLITMTPGLRAVKAKCIEKMTLFGCIGTA
ncbi:MAG: class II fructose-bisphosphate aldolase [Aristaeellaceae bacterium]